MFFASPPPPSFSLSSHYPSCFCCDWEYKIGNEIRHHRLTQRSSNSNRIPCANTSYSIPPCFLLSQTSYIYIHDDTCMHIWAFIRGLSLTPLSYSCSTTTTTTTAAFIFCQLLLKQQQQKQQLILSPFQSSPPSNVGQAIYYILPYSFLSSSSVPFSSPLLSQSPLTISLSLPLSHTSLGCSPFFSPLYCFSW